MKERVMEKEKLEVSEELKRIFEGDESEKSDLIAWGYRDYWPVHSRRGRGRM